MHCLIVRNVCGKPQIFANLSSQKGEWQAQTKNPSAPCRHSSVSLLKQTLLAQQCWGLAQASGNYTNSLGYVRTAVLVKLECDFPKACTCWLLSSSPKIAFRRHERKKKSKRRRAQQGQWAEQQSSLHLRRCSSVLG